MKNFMFDSFEEFADIRGLSPSDPTWEAFKMVWSMARTPSLTADEDGKLRVALEPNLSMLIAELQNGVEEILRRVKDLESRTMPVKTVPRKFWDQE